MTRPLTAEKAYYSKKASIWPCGMGMCMPCGRLATYKEDDQTRYVCATYLKLGEQCPEDPKPKHTWAGKRKCRLCGAKRLWVAPDGTRYRTILETRKAGWRRFEVRQEN